MEERNKQYYIWTIGCQMNVAESSQVAECLETAGYTLTGTAKDADIIVLNTCVVRQSAEDKVKGMLGMLKGLKKEYPHRSVMVTGCFVGPEIEKMHREYPYVDIFFHPGDIVVLKKWIENRKKETVRSNVPLGSEREKTPCAYLPIIQGCNNFCSYCIVPYRRGRERSYPFDSIIDRVDNLTARGIKEITLLGQNVSAYGRDLPGCPDLADLLTKINQIFEIQRIRFLTNHPRDLSIKLLHYMRTLGKVCEHMNVAVQSGDDTILSSMRRGYTSKYFRDLVTTIRNIVPGISLSTDVIVGFPGESDEQFNNTVSLLEDIRFDMVHVAMYSPRTGTLAWRKYEDTVPQRIKKERFNTIEAVQESISTELNNMYKGKVVDILVEGQKKGKWYGRTRTDKLTFFENDSDCMGMMVPVEIMKTSPWALQGKVRYNNELKEGGK